MFLVKFLEFNELQKPFFSKKNYAKVFKFMLTT